MSIQCRLRMSHSFSNYLHFGGFSPCFCEFSRIERPGRKLLLTVEVLIYRDRNRNVPNQSSETKKNKVCFLVLPRMFSENKKISPF